MSYMSCMSHCNPPMVRRLTLGTLLGCVLPGSFSKRSQVTAFRQQPNLADPAMLWRWKCPRCQLTCTHMRMAGAAAPCWWFDGAFPVLLG